MGTSAQSSQSSWLPCMDGIRVVDGSCSHQETSHSSTGSGSSSFYCSKTTQGGQQTVQGHYRVFGVCNIHVVCGGSSTFDGLAFPWPILGSCIPSAEPGPLHIPWLVIFASGVHCATTSASHQFLYLPLPRSVSRSHYPLHWLYVDQVEEHKAYSSKPFTWVGWCWAARQGLPHGSCSNSNVQWTRGLFCALIHPQPCAACVERILGFLRKPLFCTCPGLAGCQRNGFHDEVF